MSSNSKAALHQRRMNKLHKYADGLIDAILDLRLQEGSPKLYELVDTIRDTMRDLGTAVHPKIYAELLGDRKIHAIKQHRALFGTSLADAKKAVDKLEEQLRFEGRLR